MTEEIIQKKQYWVEFISFSKKHCNYTDEDLAEHIVKMVEKAINYTHSCTEFCFNCSIETKNEIDSKDIVRCDNCGIKRNTDKTSNDMKDKIKDIIISVEMTTIEPEEAVNKLFDLFVVSSMFSAKQMEQAYNDGVEAEQQRCGEFDIENYC